MDVNKLRATIPEIVGDATKFREVDDIIFEYIFVD